MKKIFTFLSPLIFCLLILISVNSIHAQTPQYTYEPPVATGLNIPLNNYSTGNYTIQFIYTPGDINGAVMGMITRIYLRSWAANAGPTITNLEIKLGQPSQTSYAGSASPLITGLTSVLVSPSFTVINPGANSWLPFNLTTPFFFNPTLPLVVEFASDVVTAGVPINVGNSATNKIQLATPRTAANGNGALGANQYHAQFGIDVTPGSPGPQVPALASFVYNPSIDTAWIQSPYTFVNTSNNLVRSYWDVVSYSSVGP
ncbi:MAG: hypothetical protein ACK445_12955, partial [Bacteroidota bacterium]